MSEYVLEMKHISKSFSGVQVLNDVSVAIKPGEVHVLLGENGAGKSTLIKILSGAYKREEGEIWLLGEPVKIDDPRQALGLGISVIYQEFNLNPYMPIYENIYMGKEFMKKGFVDHKRAIREARCHLQAVGLDIDPRTLVRDLSVAQKQMVEIAKAVSMDVKILVLDEPTAAITDTETEKLFALVRTLKAKGIGIIYISHRMKEIFEIGDRCTVLRDGEWVDTIEIKDVDEDQLTHKMVGRNISFAYDKNPHCDPDTAVLKVRDLQYKNFLKDINFDLKKGEILGITGLVGAGRSETAKCIIGALKRSGGEVSFGDTRIMGKSPREAIQKGIVYLSEDRKDEGLVLKHSVRENICLPNMKKFGRVLLSHKKQCQVAQEYVDKLRIKTASCSQAAQQLSGGNQQKVVIAKWLYSDAKVYIFDEPTRGIDVGAREEIYNIMRELVAQGSSIITISSDLVEVLRICDRILVMCEGKIAAELDNEEGLTQQKIVSYAINGG